MCRLTQSNSAKGKNQINHESPRGLYFSRNKTNKKKDKMRKLKISGRTSVLEIKIKIESRKETRTGQNLALFLTMENKRAKVPKIKIIFIQIRPVKPNQL